ncbi:MULTISPECIES: glycoside hydrolase family 3 C-terminal domain-containing protein [Oceanobacillus]|uniref:beta-glucosidase family protein n=1 Tax=Oceanobacillus TaxID=182709 RepID=UPI000984C56E|nr:MULTISPECIES: glycoside hydrolase family 3 C-terminal domain-containing protein [Oceanobacillus]MBT2599363.1 glycoside hydrolase family 3 C-terminal domain-containing protein [Oceanobacillus sp. ISL-74]MBT2652281.1 glycoside hydrolase family 3 C-terminal domain-containing protein [Oceanobacillus sp. ISL-73]
MTQQENIQQLIQELTLEEKAGLCSGLNFWHTKPVERLGIPSVMVTDGPHGLRKQQQGADHLGLLDSVPATCFPSAAGLAGSWDRNLIDKVGVALGEECQAEDVAVLLGPGANIKRSPLCGRNFEYFSEDPFLSSELAASHITGVQSQGVGTSLKHFAANNQEHRRMSTDAVVDERTLREIYLASFEGAVKKAQPWTVMCAYNQVNGEFASENKTLLTDILKKQWGHEGFVVSDWGAVNERVHALEAGLELEMPSSNGEGDKKIIEAVKNGNLSEDVLNNAVERLLTIIFRSVDEKKENATYDKETHHALARQVASESMVLLKNEEEILPLKKEGNIAVLGAFAKHSRYQGGGSSHVVPTKLDSAFDEVEKLAGEANVSYGEGYKVDSDNIDDQLILEAKDLAIQSDIAVVFAGLPDRYESEGYDRTHLQIPANHQRLIEAVSEVQPNVIVVLNNGAPIEMPWLGNVKGLIEAYLGGQAFGGAVADVLFGEVNPSGKLAETFPQKLSDNPSYLNFPGEGDKVEYKEGIFTGYRYYDTKEIEPLFPFGYGLSYTTFDYTAISVDEKELTDEETVDVHVSVKNTGKVAGKEVIQLYIRDAETSVIRPAKELKGFEKVALDPGEETTVTFTLDKRAFAYYNIQLKDWHVETGEFEILVGKSSRDILLKEVVKVESTVSLPVSFSRTSTIGDILLHPHAGSVLQETLAEINKNNQMMEAAEGEQSEMLVAMMKYMPLRTLVSFNESFSEEMLSDLLKKLNDTVS